MPAAKVSLRPPAAADQKEFLARARASRALHGRWIQAPETAAAFRKLLERVNGPGHCGLLVCERGTEDIAGAIIISNIILGAFRSGYTGYYAFAGYEGRGLMREGLRAAVRHAFGELGLHRLEANIQPDNAASIALARSCGFALEGYSPRYLKIAGRWRDHERWAIRAS